MKKILYATIILSFFSTAMACAQGKEIVFKLVVASTPLSKPLPDSVTVRYINWEHKPWQATKHESRGKNELIWLIRADEPILFTLPLESNNQFKQFMLEPGDDIIANYKDGVLKFEGKGAEKLVLGNEIASLAQTLQKPRNEFIFETHGLQDYLEWKAYLNRQWAFAQMLIKSNESVITASALDQIKISFLNKYDYQLSWKFRMLQLPEQNIDKNILNRIFDEDFYSQQMVWLRSQPTALVGEHGIFGFNRAELARKNNFPADHKSPNESLGEFSLRLYENGLKNYRGYALENALADFMITYVLEKFKFSPVGDTLFERYYNDKSRDPAFKAYVKQKEEEARRLKNWERMPDFTITDQRGNKQTKQTLKGKVALLLFTNTTHDDLDNSIRQLAREFKDNDYVEFLTLSPSKIPDSVRRNFNITSYPSLFIISLSGQLVQSSFLDSALTVSSIRSIIQRESTLARIEDWQAKTDGPYIVDRGQDGKSYQMTKGNIKLSKSPDHNFQVASDEPDKYFTVLVHQEHSVEPSVFEQPEKLLVISDIEGNLSALKALLQANGVIDKNYDWTFGKGHLVFAGDMFDRGEQVTECLWLMYSLENKAKLAGGYVHFILGNHEIMNLDGNHKYTKSKYKMIAEKTGQSLVELYGPKTVLGQWLRTKNIVEKIGDLLFLHGGISKEVNDLGLSVQQINEMVRPYYGNSEGVKRLGNEKLSLLFDTQLSPFWYRNYFMTTDMNTGLARNKVIVKYKAPVSLINDVLTKFDVNRIVTGHTEAGLTEEERGKHITIHFDGRVINTDTRHAEGRSEALLIEYGQYYAVNKSGERRPLNISNKKKELEADKNSR